MLADLAATRQVVEKLHDLGIDERNIHAIASNGLWLDDLPESRLVERQDLLPALVAGVIRGSRVCGFAHIVGLSIPEAGLVLAGAPVFDSALARGDIDRFLAKLTSGADADTYLSCLRERIDGGEVLLIVDFADDRDDEMSQLLGRRCPRIPVNDRDSRLPRFP